MTVRFRKATKFVDEVASEFEGPFEPEKNCCLSKTGRQPNVSSEGDVGHSFGPSEEASEEEVDAGHDESDSDAALDRETYHSYSLWNYFWSELTRFFAVFHYSSFKKVLLFVNLLALFRGYSLQNDVSRYTEKRRKVYAFIRIPVELEKFLFYGFMQCVDAFCYLPTFLPLRLCVSFELFVVNFLTNVVILFNRNSFRCLFWVGFLDFGGGHLQTLVIF